MPAIAFLGDPSDLGTVYLQAFAERAGVRTLSLPESTLGADWTFDIDEAGRGLLEAPHRISASSLAGVVCRLHPQPPLPIRRKVSKAAHETFVRERRAAIVHFADRLACPVANRPSKGRVNASKPLQMMELEALGLRIPSWIVTNDASKASSFARRFAGGAIVKSCSGLRARVRALDDDALRLLDGACPTIVQERIVGFDVRVHVVGSQSFGTKIATSGGIDYRFDRTRRRYSPIEVPDEVAQHCVAVRRASELVVAGLDFRVSRSGRWFCLESNPAPSFIAYEMQTRQPIGAAILLALGVRQRAIERALKAFS